MKEDVFTLSLIDNSFAVYQDNIFYMNAITVNGINEIDMHSEVYAYKMKHAKSGLNKTFM